MVISPKQVWNGTKSVASYVSGRTTVKQFKETFEADSRTGSTDHWDTYPVDTVGSVGLSILGRAVLYPSIALGVAAIRGILPDIGPLDEPQLYLGTVLASIIVTGTGDAYIGGRTYMVRDDKKSNEEDAPFTPIQGGLEDTIDVHEAGFMKDVKRLK